MKKTKGINILFLVLVCIFIFHEDIKLYADDESMYIAECSTPNFKNIFKYLTSDMGLSSTAACGILANIYYESGGVADILESGYTWNTGGGYGICQWTNTPRTSSFGRRTSLVNYCELTGKNYKSLKGQLAYLEYELTTSYVNVLNALKDINVSSNPKIDAYNAAYLWCTKFEVPADAENVAVKRGNFAKKLWKIYSNNSVNTAAPKFVGNIYPETLIEGKGYPVRGNIVSVSGKLKKVKICIVSRTGKTICSKSVKLNTKTYNTSLLDNYITFDKLKSGIYFYRILATTADGTYTLLNKDFVVCPTNPVKVKGFKQSGKGAGKIALKWNQSIGADGYIIWRSDAIDGKYKKIAILNGSNNISYIDTGLKKYGEYYYKISSFITRDTVTNYSDQSEVVVARTKPYTNSVYKIIRKNTTIKKNAGTGYAEICSVNKGKKVRIIYRTKDRLGNGWYYVKCGKYYGYIRSNFIVNM